MRIKMLETRCGTENGFTIRRYCGGSEYDVADSLARSFLAAGFAVAITKSDGAESGSKTDNRVSGRRSVGGTPKNTAGKASQKLCRTGEARKPAKKSKKTPTLRLIKE